MTDIVDTVRQGIAKFTHETACGIIGVETLAVHREVLEKLCDEIEKLRQQPKREWRGLGADDVNDFNPLFKAEEAARWAEAKLKEKNT